jgi:hypothetical protein
MTETTQSSANTTIKQNISIPINDTAELQSHESEMMLETLSKEDNQSSSEPVGSIAETNANETNDSKGQLCPLFMDQLPSDFASNSGLAAIASLLNDDADEVEEESITNKTSEVTLKSGGGKVSRRRTNSNRHSPYKSGKKVDSPKKETTVGEAQLFLSMWKM